MHDRSIRELLPFAANEEEFLKFEDLQIIKTMFGIRELCFITATAALLSVITVVAAAEQGKLLTICEYKTCDNCI